VNACENEIDQKKIMKPFNDVRAYIIRGGIALAMTVALSTALADDKTTPPKPDKLTTCPVSGEKLDSMGKPFVFVYEGQEVKLCCKGCKKDFDKDPAPFIKKIRAADKPASDKSAKN
jgi:YHS domain-containing protein